MDVAEALKGTRVEHFALLARKPNEGVDRVANLVKMLGHGDFAATLERRSPQVVARLRVSLCSRTCPRNLASAGMGRKIPHWREVVKLSTARILPRRVLDCS
jgi:hypothetical protein